MRTTKVPGIPRLNTTPLATIRTEDSRIIVELDDESEKRFELSFEIFQAMRIITADCFIVAEGIEILPNTVIEVLESGWIAELKANLSRIDETASFMEKARHFIVPLQDIYLEVVAWKFAVSE